MIKKEYIQPTVKAVKILLPTILAGSGDNPNVDPNAEESDWTSEDEIG